VAGVVLLPDRGELHVRPGDPSRSATVTFSFETPPGQQGSDMTAARA
jgi:hypothetical protein